MEFPKWHDRPNDSDKPVNKQNVLDGKNFLKMYVFCVAKQVLNTLTAKQLLLADLVLS